MAASKDGQFAEIANSQTFHSLEGEIEIMHVLRNATTSTQQSPSRKQMPVRTVAFLLGRTWVPILPASELSGACPKPIEPR